MATAASSPPRSPTVPFSDPDPDPSPPSAPPPETQSQPTPPASAPGNPRRPPPPCWSPDETVALIDIYSEKWNSLGRASLKPNHWQEVADAVASRCPVSSPPKTPTQCRHKIEKLRKRYRAEIRRAESLPTSRFTSSWVHFKQMEAMDRSRSGSGDNENDNDDDDMDPDFDEPGKRKKARAGTRSSSHHIYNPNGIGAGAASRSNNAGGFRIKIPTPAPQKLKSFEPNSNANSGVARPRRGLPLEKRSRHGSDPLGEVVSAVKVFREGFQRTERMKIELAKEMGEMQREMEMKRTEMILESQQFIVETLAKAMSEKKTKKNNSKKNEVAPGRIPTS